MAKEETTGLGLVEAKVLASKLSRGGKVQYILVDAEGDCEVSEKPDNSAYAAYRNGSEISLSSDLAAELKTEPKKKASKKKETVEEQDEVEALLETEPKSASKKSSTTKTEKVMATKTKKSAPKKAAKVAKKAATPKKVVAVGPAEIKAGSIAEAVKQARKDGIKKAIVHVKGKVYGLRSSTGWAVVRSIVELGKDGFIMDVQGIGYYVYNKADHKELFGKIFSSGTYKNIGIYSQSTLPKWHEEHFTALK
jgi:hypothetical protein